MQVLVHSIVELEALKKYNDEKYTIRIKSFHIDEPPEVVKFWKNAIVKIENSENYEGQLILRCPAFKGSQRNKPFEKLIPIYPFLLRVEEKAEV